MKNFFSIITASADLGKEVSAQSKEACSVSMEFEDSLLESSRVMSSFSDEWVDIEIERSKRYFYEKLKEA